MNNYNLNRFANIEFICCIVGRFDIRQKLIIIARRNDSDYLLSNNELQLAKLDYGTFHRYRLPSTQHSMRYFKFKHNPRHQIREIKPLVELSLPIAKPLDVWKAELKKKRLALKLRRKTK